MVRIDSPEALEGWLEKRPEETRRQEAAPIADRASLRLLLDKAQAVWNAVKPLVGM